MGKFLITEEEKSNILGMYYKTMGKKLVIEQKRDPEEFRKAGINQLTALSIEDVQEGRYAVYFTENTNGNSYYYGCATNPKHDAEPWNKPGAIYDSSLKITNDAFVESKTPEFKKIMSQECKVVFDYLAQQKDKNTPQPQVAGTTTAKPVAAPNPVSDADVAARQKISQQTKLNSQQATQQLIAKLSDPNFLNYNKEKTELDKDAQELSTFMATASPTGDDALTLKNKIKVLLKYKPEYGKPPYSLTSNF